ncbi:uncharacterized protein N0V89_012380 [Didymosphaeria variabile]|uniref:Uncharacterized protein n=1 Tax=Didymosphaeria variabile TaxID=1932322 RepID=A0A9W8X998_9PLEO|nr:uncharacterized protein N0V89_012380 [Didymosphaeria variabile]KAJ4344636.1 hypothetical protein N0V89_012380 [Didymosphaeria variabile]
MNASVAKHPYLADQSSFAPSLKAVSQYTSPIDEDTGSDSAYAAISSFYQPQPAIYDIREVPDTHIYGFNGPYSDDGVDTNSLQVYSKLENPKRRSSSPYTPQGYLLPPAEPLSPFPNFQGEIGLSSQPPSLSEGSMSPILGRPATPRYIPTKPTSKQGEQHKAGLAIQNIGWDDFRSSRVSIDTNGHTAPASLPIAWPKPDKQVPPIAAQSKFEENVPKKKTIKYALPPSVEQCKKSRKHSDMETLMRVHNFGKRLQVVYHQGPKGEGQKMWNGIRRKQKEKRELKPTQAPLKASWAARSPRTQATRTEVHKEQLKDLHAAALDVPAPRAPFISPPLQSRPKPPVPARPAPLGILRSPVSHKPLPGSVPMKLRGSVGSQGKVSTTSAYTYHSWDVPVAASQSVQYDSQESIIDYSQSKARVPILDPAPKPKATQKKGLPPRPVLAPGEQEPPELAEQERMYKLRVGTDAFRPAMNGLPPPPMPPVGSMFSTAPSKSQINLPAGPGLAVSSQFPYVASKSHNTFAFLEDRHTEHPRHNKVKDKEPKSRFAELASTFFDVPSQPKEGPSKDKDGAPKHTKEHLANLLSLHKNKAHLKHQQKIKANISNPRPMLAPNGFTANFSTAAGGVDGPAAAVAVAPKIPNPALAHGKANLPPPIPPRPADYVFPHSASQTNLHAKGKAKKEKKANWAVPFSRPRARRDSDASMVCADARQSERKHQHGREQEQKEHGSGVLNMMTFMGPVRQQVEEIKLRDPGPSRQAHTYQYSDESLVPEPLGVRKSETARTEASFYRKYDSLIGEYRDSGYRSGEGRSGWF